MKFLVTGAGGFIGRAVAGALADQPGLDVVRLVDRTIPSGPPGSRFQTREIDLTAAGAAEAVLEGIDTVIHLASVPGGTSEEDPSLSRRVNVDATLALLEVLDRRGRPSRFVYASTIAVFGRIKHAVNDATAPEPRLVYGAHKRMVEIALADFHRRGRVSTIALRLPGIVARPRGDRGLRSAFMSDIFHAARAGEPFTMPVGPDATMWIMSADRVARNLVHAANLEQPQGKALNLPALRITASDLVQGLYGDRKGVHYDADEVLQADFGSYPILATPAADALGFRHDGSLENLIQVAA